MEFLPVLDPVFTPQEGIWYSLMPNGSAPGVTVGHTCVFVPSVHEGKGRIVIVGGANPSGSFADSQIINLDDHEWDIPDWEGLEARYEHCCFVPQSSPQSLWVFGGAQLTGNRNCIQKIELTDSKPKWKTVTSNGKPPSPRTYHSSSACIGDKLYVFSGGECGASPVSDPKLHVFDAVSSTWSQPDTHGRPPPARHGHIVVAVGAKIFIHGGMSGNKFFNDMFSLDSESLKWEKVQAKGDIPSGVASHSAVALGKNIYMCGGMTAEGASNSMYRFNTEKSRWTLMKFDGDMPPNRLDHSICIFQWKPCCEGTRDGERTHPVASETLNLAFVFGGMDTQGTIFNDCVVTVVK